MTLHAGLFEGVAFPKSLYPSGPESPGAGGKFQGKGLLGQQSDKSQADTNLPLCPVNIKGTLKVRSFFVSLNERQTKKAQRGPERELSK